MFALKSMDLIRCEPKPGHGATDCADWVIGDWPELDGGAVVEDHDPARTPPMAHVGGDGHLAAS
jgi:hypothetical protein